VTDIERERRNITGYREVARLRGVLKIWKIDIMGKLKFIPTRSQNPTQKTSSSRHSNSVIHNLTSLTNIFIMGCFPNM